MKRNSRFGCGLFLAVNLLALIALMLLAARAGMLFPSDCGVNVELEACARIHAEEAQPAMLALGVVIGANLIVAINWIAKRIAR